MKYIRLLIIILSPILGWSQNSLQGTVYDKDTKETLPGVAVYIPDLKIGTVTDSVGNFSFTNMSSGKFLIEIKFKINSKIYQNSLLFVFDVSK